MCRFNQWWINDKAELAEVQGGEFQETANLDEFFSQRIKKRPYHIISGDFDSLTKKKKIVSSVPNTLILFEKILSTQ